MWSKTILLATGLILCAASLAGEPVPTRRLVALPDAGSFDGDRDVKVLGNTLFVGDALNDGVGSNMGTVLIYEKTPGGWIEIDELQPEDDIPTQWFGYSVDADRDPESGDEWLIVGAPAPFGQGSVYLYRNVEGTWEFHQRILSPEDEDQFTQGERFGWDVAIDVSVPQKQPDIDPLWTIAIGAPKFRLPLTVNTTGGVLVTFLNSFGLWQTPPEPPIAIEQDAVIGSDMGYSVAIAGDMILAGAPAYDDSGSFQEVGAYHQFVRGAFGQWAGNAVFENPIPSGFSGDRFGHSVAVANQAIDGTYDWVVGAPGFSEGAVSDRRGAAYIYSTNQVSGVSRTEPQTGDQFGTAVDIDESPAGGDNIIYISSPTINAGERGAVLQFSRQLIQDPWALTQQIKLNDTASGQPGQSAAVGLNISVYKGDPAISVRGVLGGSARSVYTADIPIFLGNFEL